MNSIQKQIVQEANVYPNVLDCSYKTLPSIKKDISKRLKSQRKAFDKNETTLKNIEFQPHVRSIIREAIEKLSITLEAINKIEEQQNVK